ncbi:hypothetical protein GGTG_04240 [Gaeumannomyces tritici R3-111a-1]|uniref:BTB domain-containing protein n=1 Tax=Gaeumannomyces tritici (strain R3-111a-1) TaxID=644352 RepID=J3NSI9_GAET3|nr:hypothetical protein GGTG_04240 [Gaeumannomyces tritici R3-111a-1]EJT79152.1 hypothetical protein GGTG_04240 [Gaeumannomyces tritici R3-111a-1]
MVSQPDHHISSSLALRGASSLVPTTSGGGGGGSTSGSDRHHHHYPQTNERHAASVVGAGSGREGGGGGGGGSSARSSTSRARRYNRSHAGGTSSSSSAYMPQNEFPVFSHSGDVEIVVRVQSGHENKYLLHRHTLTRFSGFFEASMSSEWSRARAVPALPSPSSPEGGAPLALTQGTELARVAGSGGVDGLGINPTASEVGTTPTATPSQQQLGPTKKRWRYELDLGAGGNDIPMLVQKEEESSPIPTERDRLRPPTNSLFGGGGAQSSSSRKHQSSTSSAHNTPSIGSHGFFRSVANLGLTHHRSSSSREPSLPPPTQAEQDLLRDYDNLFRIMYNYPPLLDSINIADAYVQCKSLLGLADQYDALAVVGPRVDHHLLQFQSRLWRQIAKYPISYLRLAYLARSRVIFQEALIHVVGQWPAGERSLRAALPPQVLDLIEDKVDELEESVTRVESRLFRLGLTTRAGERVSPSTAYLDWLAVSLFRQWLADNTSPPPTQSPPALMSDRRGGGDSSSSSRDGPIRSSRDHRHGHHHSHHRRGSYDDGPSNHVTTVALPPLTPPPLASLGRTYRTLGSATSVAYLGHDECKRFLKLSGELYSRDNLRRFEKRLDELKAMAREVVRPLMGSELELDVAAASGGGGKDSSSVGYLTCTRVDDRDLPWAHGR